MISINIKDINNFMSHLLTQNTFDDFCLRECEILTSTSFSINGHINSSFYEPDEYQSLCDNYISWGEIRPIAFNIINGKKAPSNIKIVLSVSSKKYQNILSNIECNIEPDNISGLFLHINYTNHSVQIITGTSLNIFTLDKSLDKQWDDMVKSFLLNNFQIDIS